EWSDALFEIYGVSRETFAATLEAYMTIVHPEDRERIGKVIERAMTTDQRSFSFDTRVLLPGGEVRHTTSYGLAMVDDNGRPCQLSGAVLDITARVREEQRRLTMQQELIEAQQKTLRELGAPIIPLAEGMLVVPLVGALDPARAELLLDSLLVTVSDRHAQTVILDVTGVPTMDVEVARALMKVVPAVRLLGADVVLTGLQPGLARTLIDLDIDMRQVVTRANLQEGLEHAAQLKLQR
ncbi:MAG: PAS domain-containing protein, partial [Byssovorax sp.]